jgi:nitrate/nitrite transporter NarK
MEPAATEAESPFSQSAAVLVAALFVWGTSVVRVVGTFVYHERFGAESTLALVMVLLMSRVLFAPLAARWGATRQRS